MPTDKSQITTWMGFSNQAAYGTAIGNDADMRRIIESNQNTFEGIGEPEFANNADYATGSDLASDVWAIRNQSSLSVPFDFSFQDIGFFLLDALGGYSVTALGFGRYQHVFTAQNADTSRQLPSRTILKRYGALETILARDMVCNSFSLVFGKSGRISVNSAYQGSGYYEINPSGYSEPSEETDRVFGFNQQAAFYVQENSTGTAQVETATVAGTIGASGAGNVGVIITSSLITKTLSVAVANNDTAAQVAEKIRTAIAADLMIRRYFTVSGSSTSVILTAVDKAANDTTLNVAINNGTSSGLTPALTSANTTAGVAPTKQTYTCALESATFTSNTPIRDGNRACDDFLVDDTPESGAVASEALFGQRSLMLEFSVRLESGDKMLDWLKAGNNLYWKHRIFSNATEGMSLVLEHTKARVVSAKRTIDGDYIAVSGKLELLSTDGSIGFTATLINDIADYAP